MRTDDLKLLAAELRGIAADVMEVRETVAGTRTVTLRGAPALPVEEAAARLRERFAPLGVIPMVSRDGDGIAVRVVRAGDSPRPNPLVNVVLFLLTAASTLFVGAAMAGVDIIAEPGRWRAGVPFAASILAILLVHEFGHYLMSACHGVKASLPYFIPAPTIIGTFGAVIKTRSPIPDRRSLLDIGAAGPICGFLVALVALAVGIHHSEVVEIGPLLQDGDVMEFGDSLLVRLVTRAIKGGLGEGEDILFSPVAFAGWVGLLVTAFNLMPVGQLDGGHIIYAVAGRRHAIIARATVVSLLLLGLYWPPWWGWVLLILLIGPGHAPPVDDVTPIGGGRRLVALAALGIFILCFVPAPIPLRGAF
ncbi:MAG: site-2 protease family protein [bacterium]|nr:site-2 protease family protein [bacterium]